MDTDLRRAGPGDAVLVAWHRYPGETGDHLTVYADWLPGAMAEGRYLGWLARRGGRIVGGAGLLLIPWQPSRSDPHPVRGRVVNVFVEPEVRRQGLAHSLLEVLLEEAKSQGLRVLNLGTTAEGRALYRRLGFQPSESEMWLRLNGSPIQQGRLAGL